MAQQDTIVNLQEVVISDTQLHNFSGTQSVLELNDSVINRNAPALTSLLRYNSVIFFKENGPGMVSSPSFRGTTAQQTAVIWNGININSQLNGQTDFNILNASDFKTVSVRAGGGSVIYGSSAIGGSIHLNNGVTFNNHFNNEARVTYGSYNTLNANYKLDAATDSFSTSLSISRNSSDNDFEYPGTPIKNDNGQYYNTSYNAVFGYKLNAKNSLRLYSYAFDGERHFSRTLAAPSRSKYQDTNTRSMLEWTGEYYRFTSKLKAAYLTEDYKYFENTANNNYTFGKVRTYIARYDALYKLSKFILINTIADYTQNNGEGSDIVKEKRSIGSVSLLMKHSVTTNFDYEAGMRQEVSNIYNSPLLFSFGAKYNAASFYTVKFNASRNFRIPTFNDLYWQGSGNPDLNPETSYQAELGNEVRYKNATLSLTGYYIKLRDMLRWVPTGGIWHPENVGKVNTYGAEALFNWNKTMGSSHFEASGTYAYTVSQEDGNSNQLIYVPFHKATGSLAYSYKKLSVYYTHLFNGKVFFTSDNQSEIDPYNVSNLGIEYTFSLVKGLTIGAQVLNLFNEEYQNVSMRPMPGRNYNVNLNFKF